MYLINQKEDAMKWGKKKILFSVGAIALLTTMTWFIYRYYNQQNYGQYHQYTGKAKIDDYEMIADGAGVIVHWGSITPEEDKKMYEFGSFSSNKIDQKSSRYILRQNIKLKELPYRMIEKASEDEYWTLSVYSVNGKNLEEEKEIDLFKVVEHYNSDYIPAELGGIYSWNGQDYLWIEVRDLNHPQKTKPLFLNLKSREIEENKIFAQDNVNKPHIKQGTSWDKKVSWINTISAGGEFSLDKAYLGETHFERSSKAYQILDKGNATIYILNSKNSSEQFEREARVYSLFMPETVNVYEEVTIPSELSINSQEHIINSKAEFNKFFDVEKAKKLNHETK